MGNLHLVTGYAGQEHVTAADHGAFNAALIGTGQFVLEKGKVFEVQVISNNQIRVLDGELMMQGRFVRLNPGTFVDLTIESGAQGVKRNDLVAARYTRSTSTGVEEVSLVVIKGTAAASNPVDPKYTEGDVASGEAVLNDFPLWRIPLDGLNVGTPEMLFDPFIDSMRTLPVIRQQVNQIHSEVDAQLAAQDAKIEAKIEELDEYTKNEVLSNNTKALFGFGTDALPNDVFAFLGKFNQHWWKRRTSVPEAIPSGFTLLAATSIEGNPTMDSYSENGSQVHVASVAVSYGSKVSVATDGTVTIVNAQTVTVEAEAGIVVGDLEKTVVWNGAGLFFSVAELGNAIYFGTSGCTLSVTSARTVNHRAVELTGVQEVEGYPATTEAIVGEWGYVQASDRNAYPDSGVEGIHEYDYVGVPFENMLLKH